MGLPASRLLVGCVGPPVRVVAGGRRSQNNDGALSAFVHLPLLSNVSVRPRVRVPKPLVIFREGLALFRAHLANSEGGLIGAIIRSVAISVTVAAVLVWPLANADASTSFKTGTYKAKGKYTTNAGAIVESHFKVLLKRGSCAAAPSQPKSSTRLCVSLPVSPRLVCSNGVSVASLLGSFATPVQLLNSGNSFNTSPSPQNRQFPERLRPSANRSFQ
jgi:hypothetical protein